MGRVRTTAIERGCMKRKKKEGERELLLPAEVVPYRNKSRRDKKKKLQLPQGDHFPENAYRAGACKDP